MLLYMWNPIEILNNYSTIVQKIFPCDYFDNMTIMMDHYHLLLIKRLNTTTPCHAHGVSVITIK